MNANKRPNKQETLCRSCERSDGRCPWSSNLVPVKGWTAERIPYKCENKNGVTYRVIECPLFCEFERSAERGAWASACPQPFENNKRWTKKETEILRVARKQHLKIATVADILGRTEDAIRGKIRAIAEGRR